MNQSVECQFECPQREALTKLIETKIDERLATLPATGTLVIRAETPSEFWQKLNELA